MKNYQYLLIASAFCGTLLLSACGRKTTAVDRNGAEPSGPVRDLDACTLLTGEEIQAIQGSPMTGAKSSGSSDGGLRVSQCFYSTAEFTKSVSVAVTQADSASSNPRSATSYWHDTFGRYEGKPEEKEGDEEKRESLKKQGGEHEEEEAAPPKKIDGVGNAAYWTPNRVGGALYVLHNDVIIRVSVGGVDPEDKKIGKCKELAEKALTRM